MNFLLLVAIACGIQKKKKKNILLVNYTNNNFILIMIILFRKLALVTNEQNKIN